jgi:hypothetical protein
MAQTANQNALAGLDKLIAETRTRLEANPDFVALNALQKARAEIVGVKGALPTPANTLSLFHVEYADAPHIDVTPRRVSQLAAAEKVLDRMGHPMPVADLMDGAIKEGAVLAGAKPIVSFASSLSKSDKFKSVRWNGAYAWWFTDRPIPSRKQVRDAQEAAE